jgi:hypothetical protein
VPVIEATGENCAAPPLNPFPVGVVQVYKVPAGMIPVAVVEGSIENPTPEQVAVVSALILALGSRLTNKEKVVPLQEPEIVLT